MSFIPRDVDLDDWSNAQYTTERAKNISASDTETPTSATTTGITFRGKEHRIAIDTKSTWKAQKEKAYNDLLKKYRNGLIDKWVKAYSPLYSTVGPGSGQGSISLGGGGTRTAYGSATTLPKGSGANVYAQKTRYRIRSPDRDGYYTESVQELTPFQASRLRYLGYSLNIVSKQVPTEAPVKIALSRAFVPQTGGVNYRGNKRVRTVARTPLLIGTTRKSEIISSANRRTMK